MLWVAGISCIAILTLSPQYAATKPPPSLCLLCGERSVLDAILNVLLFIPFGMGMRLAGISRRRAFAIGLVTTITVELLQLWIPGRDTSLGDVLTNSLGGFIGIICADIWRVIVFPSRRAASRLAGGWTLLWVLVLAVSAELAHISLPSTTVWGTWRPELLHQDYFAGKVLAATAAGLPTPYAINGASAEVRRRLSSDSVVVRATIVGGIRSDPIAAIASVYDYRRSQIFMLGERKGNLIFSIRMRTADARVATPDIRLDSVFPPHRPAKPDTMLVAGGLIHNRLWISVRTHGVTREHMAKLTGDSSPACGACGGSGARLSIDHDHNHCPGERGCEHCVRGYLCQPCNTAEGLLRTSARARALADYIDRTALSTSELAALPASVRRGVKRDRRIEGANRSYYEHR